MQGKLENMPGHGGNRTYDLWNTIPMLCQLTYAVTSVRVCDTQQKIVFLFQEKKNLFQELFS